jgi:hypothetical protein
MAVRSLLSVVAVLTCLTLNEGAACPTEHAAVASATQAFSHDVEDESFSTYILELGASAPSSYEASFSSTDDERPTSFETLSTRASADVNRERQSSHLGEILPSSVLDAFWAQDASEYTLSAKVAQHFLDSDDEAGSAYSELTAAADLNPATTGSIPLNPWAVHHRRDE